MGSHVSLSFSTELDLKIGQKCVANEFLTIYKLFLEFMKLNLSHTPLF